MTAGALVMDCPEQPTLPFDHVSWRPSAPTPIETMAMVATSPGPDVIVDGRYRILRRVGAAAITGRIDAHDFRRTAGRASSGATPGSSDA